MKSYIVFRILVALLLGIVAYVVDRRRGARLYRWWYGMTHEFPLSPEVLRGYICSQPAKKRALVAVVLASAVTVLTVLFTKVEPLHELVVWLASIPALFVGFLLGPSVNRLWQKRDDVFGAVDQWEKGEIDLSAKLKTRSAGIGSRMRGWVRRHAWQRSDGPAEAATRHREHAPLPARA